MAYYFDKALSRLDLNRLEHKKQATKILLPIIAKLPDVVDKDFWLKKLSQLIDVEAKFLYEALPQGQTPINQPTASPTTNSVPAPKRAEILSENLIALLLKFPSFIKYMIDYLTPEQLASEDLRIIYSQLIMYYNETVSQEAVRQENFVLNYDKFIDWLGQNQETKAAQEQLFNKLFILAEKDFYSYSPEQANQEIKQITKILKTIYLNKRLQAITQLITEMEQEQPILDHSQELNSLLEEFNHLTGELRQFN
jgi:DNA primase